MGLVSLSQLLFYNLANTMYLLTERSSNEEYIVPHRSTLIVGCKIFEVKNKKKTRFEFSNVASTHNYNLYRNVHCK